MTSTIERTMGRAIAVALAMALLLAGVVGVTGAAAHPGHKHAEAVTEGIGVIVNSPAELTGFHPAVQWGDTGELDEQTAELVYAGTGCSPANYVPIADQIQGNIALVVVGPNPQNPADVCPAATFFQRVRSAQEAGAIGYVQIPGLDADGNPQPPTPNATAVAADIPALEVFRTDAVVAVWEAVLEGEAVEVTLADTFERVELTERLSDIPCVDGQADVFECDGIDLLSFVPYTEFDGGTRAEGLGQSDLWGWTDEDTGDEYVMMGKTNGTAFFRVTDPFDPVYLGALPNPALLHEVWHDIKVYEGHAFIVSESEPHGMTVFDLRRLRDIEEAQEWDADAFYPLTSAAHNVVINEETGFAYIVGGNAALVVPDICLSGLHMVDISTPTQPTFAGCYLEEGGPGTLGRTVGEPYESMSPAAYVHDTECVIYDGPDERYVGRELCFNAAETGLVIADVTDKLAPVTVGMTDYAEVAYAHQGSLTEDHRFVLLNDELDEIGDNGIDNTRTIVLDVTDLEDPKVHFEHLHDTTSIDHNNYVVGDLVYQSNYTSGLRVLDVSAVDDPEDPRLEPFAFFDTFPTHGEPTFEGTWSNYPYFESGTIAVSGIDEGLFLLRLADEDEESTAGVAIACLDCPAQVRAGEEGSASLAVLNRGDQDDTFSMSVSGLPDGWTATFEPTGISLAPGQVGGVSLTLEVPRNAQAGTYPLEVTPTSSVDPDVDASIEVPVEVRKGKPSDAGPPEDRGAAGQGGPSTADAAGGERTTATLAGSTSPSPAPGVALLLLVVTTIALAASRRIVRPTA